MSKLTVLIGLPGSGKSTYAQKIKEDDEIIISSDEFREKLNGDASDLSNDKEVWNAIYDEVKKNIEEGKDIIFDATSISKKRRRILLNLCAGKDVVKKAILIATPIEVCIEQNLLRYENGGRYVPEVAIKDMTKGFSIPELNEGFDIVNIHYGKESYKTFYGNPKDVIEKNKSILHDTPYHLEDLGTHTQMVLDNLKGKGELLETAALLHDCGKALCKVFRDSKGNPSEIAHYYGHEKTSSYMTLFYNIPMDMKLSLCPLIESHMKMFNKETKFLSKLENTYGSEFVENLKLLHEADLNGCIRDKSVEVNQDKEM